MPPTSISTPAHPGGDEGQQERGLRSGWNALPDSLTRSIPPAASRSRCINWDGFRTYNFDVIDGVNYQIDVTQPARY